MRMGLLDFAAYRGLPKTAKSGGWMRSSIHERTPIDIFCVFWGKRVE